MNQTGAWTARLRLYILTPESRKVSKKKVESAGVCRFLHRMQKARQMKIVVLQKKVELRSTDSRRRLSLHGRSGGATGLPVLNAGLRGWWIYGRWPPPS